MAVTEQIAATVLPLTVTSAGLLMLFSRRRGLFRRLPFRCQRRSRRRDPSSSDADRSHCCRADADCIRHLRLALLRSCAPGGCDRSSARSHSARTHKAFFGKRVTCRLFGTSRTHRDGFLRGAVRVGRDGCFGHLRIHSDGLFLLCRRPEDALRFSSRNRLHALLPVFFLPSVPPVV